MQTFICSHDGGDSEIEAFSAEQAAEIFAEDFDREDQTYWISVTVTPIDEEGDEGECEQFKIAVEPLEPYCGREGGEHDWQSPHRLVGGLRDNPGVWGSGGGVLILEACVRCGCARRTNTWACDPEDGEQGLTSVSYTEAEFDLDDNDDE